MHRLRDLGGRRRLVAVALVVALLVPFGASLARAARVGWLPSGDDALIGLRSLDAFGEHRPLIGQPSTSHLYADDGDTHHPGPIEFYWLALPVRLLGPSVGMLAGIAAVNVGALLVALWVVLRRAGPGVAAWSAVVMSGVLWSQGTALLSDPISSSAGSIALLALAAVAWAVADGDVRLVPLGAVIASWVLQQHLAIVVPAAALVAFAGAGLGAHGVGRWRAGRPREAGGADDEERRPERWWPWLVGGLATALVLWSPVLWQQATGDPGNLTAIVRYAREGGTDSIGWLAGARQAVRALGFPPLLVQWDLQGDDIFNGPLAWYDLLAALVAYGTLVATVPLAWARRRTLSVLALTVLVLAVAGAWNGASIPDSVEAFRANFYRWTFVVAWLGLTALGWVGALAARRLLLRRELALPPTVPRLAPAFAVVAVLVPAVAACATAGFDDERRDQNGFGAMRTVSDAAIERAEQVDASRITIVPRGSSAVLASTSALAMQLEAAGYEVRVPTDLEARFWGDHRILQEGEDPGELILQLVTSRGPVPSGPGEPLARVELNPELRKVLDPLIAEASGATVEVSDEGEALLAERYDDPDQRDFLRAVLATLPTKPEAVLTSPAALELLADGYLAAPSFDPDALREVAAHLPLRDVNLDDEFELRAIDEGTLAELVPSWSGR
ncbi:MAG: hypothetical protein R2711_05365 [Acidimicrobiales bacterium]